MQKGLRGAGGFNWQPVIKANHATSDKSAHLYSLPSNTNTKENETNVLANLNIFDIKVGHTRQRED